MHHAVAPKSLVRRFMSSGFEAFANLYMYSITTKLITSKDISNMDYCSFVSIFAQRAKVAAFAFFMRPKNTRPNVE
jgi:hypothetical protein